ncbi:MAG: hypothetical protein AB7M12_02850 [Hyphomonadaceae bacterium]
MTNAALQRNSRTPRQTAAAAPVKAAPRDARPPITISPYFAGVAANAFDFKA